MIRIAFFVLSFFVFGCAGVYAQDSGQDDFDPTNITSNYQFNDDVIIKECTGVEGELFAPARPVQLRQGASHYKFRVQRWQDDGSAVITFWQFSDPLLRTTFNYETLTDQAIGKYRYFVVSAKDMKEHTSKRFSTGLRSGSAFTFGLLVMPYKFRPRIPLQGERTGFEMAKDVSFGISGGFKHRISNRNPYFMSLLFNVGISDVGLDSFNTRGAVSTSKDVPARTLATGLVLDMHKVQFGFFVGWDNISDKNRSGWIYQGRPWMAFGFGYSIFSITGKASEKGEGKN